MGVPGEARRALLSFLIGGPEGMHEQFRPLGWSSARQSARLTPGPGCVNAPGQPVGAKPPPGGRLPPPWCPAEVLTPEGHGVISAGPGPARGFAARLL